MKRTAWIPAVVSLLVLGGCGFMEKMHETGEAAQRTFFEAVGSGDVARLHDLFHPELRAIVDPEPLGVWMAALNEHLGRFRKLSGVNFNVKTSTQNGQRVVESAGTAVFERGDARTDLQFVGGKVVKFEVHSDAIPDPWLTGIPDPSRYVARGKACLEKLLTDDVDGGLALMHENLRAQFTPERLAESMSMLASSIGGLHAVEHLSDTFDAGAEPALTIRYAVKGGRAEVVGKMVFKFSPWKGELLAIDVPE